MIDETLKRQRYELFIRCYPGRSDVTAQQQKDGSFKTISGGFTYERFLEQLNQSSVYGIYNVDDAGNAGFIMYDMDLFPRLREPWEQMVPKLRARREQVLALIDTLREFGVEPDQVLVEFPTVGYHVVLPLAGPLPVQQAKAFARLARDRAGLRYETPFYPQEVSGYGDMVRLPLRLNDSTGRRSNFIRDIRSFDPADYDQIPDFLPLERLRPIETSILVKALEKANRKLYRKVAQTEDIPPGSVKLVSYRGERVLLVNEKGSLYALAETCPHTEGPLSLSSPREGVITCPWHGAQFRVTTGEVLKGPARSGLIRYDVSVRKGKIWIAPAY